MGMIRKATATLIAALIASPAFAAPAAIVRLEAVPSFAAAPAPASAAAMSAPSLSASLAPSASMAPSFAAALPSAAPAPSPILAATPLTIAPAASGPSLVPSAASARGPPAAALSARTPAGVAARVADAVRAWGVPVEDILKDRDVLLVGEDHASLSTIETLAREMPRLAKAGVTVVGIEGLKHPHQGAVDDYVERRTDALPLAALGFSPARVDAFSGLLSAARENGVRVVALGLPLNQWAAQVAELAARNNADLAEAAGGDFGAQIDRAESRYEYGFNEAVAEVLLTRRNRTMAELAWNSMGKGGKAVIVAGQAHVPGPDSISAQRFHLRGDYGDLSRELAAFALRAYSLTFTGGLFTSVQAAKDDRAVRPEAHRAAAAASPDGAPAFLPLGVDSGLWHAGGRALVLAH